VLVIKPSRVGGPRVVSEIATLAADRRVAVVVSTLFETGIGIAAALRQAALLPRVSSSPGGPGGAAGLPDHGLATAGLLEHDLLRNGLPIEDGRMWLPDAIEADDAGPGLSLEQGVGAYPVGGLGVAPDERAIARYRLETIEAVGAS
jgi:L-alanine-DL-glutamate epimerase-like enolase superfamily enzyme